MSDNRKNAFNFYRSFYDVLNMLEDHQYVQLSKAINSVMFFDVHIDSISFDDPILKISWASIRHSLQSSIDGFLAKKNIEYNQALSTPYQGGSQAPCKAPCQQEKEKEKGKGKEEEEGEGECKGETASRKRNASRLAIHSLPDGWKSYAETERPDLDPLRVFDDFHDYWTAKSGKDATKLDWDATWRMWVRRQKGLPQKSSSKVPRNGFSKQVYREEI